jgi:hypothetical protein
MAWNLLPLPEGRDRVHETIRVDEVWVAPVLVPSLDAGVGDLAAEPVAVVRSRVDAEECEIRNVLTRADPS